MIWNDPQEILPFPNKRVLVFIDGDNPRYEITSCLGGVWNGLSIDDGDEVKFWSDFPQFPENKNINLNCLKENQTKYLLDHLKKHFDEDAAYFYLNSILMSINEYNVASSEVEPSYMDYRAQYELQQKAYDLYKACNKYDYLQEYQSTCWALKNTLILSSKNAFEDIPKEKKRGRPPETKLRNRLIKDIYGCYDAEGKGHLNESSHFEQTVEMILKCVEPSPPHDVHSIVKRIIKTK